MLKQLLRMDRPESAGTLIILGSWVVGVLIAAVWVLEHSLDAGEIMALATPPVQ